VNHGVKAEPPFKSILINISHLKDEDVRPITTVNLDNVKTIEDFHKAIGNPPFSKGIEGSDVQLRIAWVFGSIAYYFLSRYGTVYDPELDNDTTAPPVDSFANHGNDQLFIGDKHLPADVSPPVRIMGMVAEDIHRVYHYFIQARKTFNKAGGNPLADPNNLTDKSFVPIFLYPRDIIEEPDFAGPIAQQMQVDQVNLLTAKMCGQFASKADIDMFISMANKDKNGMIKLRGGGAGGMLEIKGPPIPVEKKAELVGAPLTTNEQYLVWSAREKRTEQERLKGASAAKEQLAITEAAADAVAAEESRTTAAKDHDYAKESKIKGAPLYDEETVDQINAVNKARDQTHRVICESGHELNKLKLIGNSEHVRTYSFFEALEGVGGKLNMPLDFDNVSNPDKWPTVTFGDIELKVHQVVGLHAIFMLVSLEDRSAVLADDVGTGKTILTLALLSLLNRQIGLGLIEAGYGKFDYRNDLPTRRTFKHFPKLSNVSEINIQNFADFFSHRAYRTHIQSGLNLRRAYEALEIAPQRQDDSRGRGRRQPR
jgi:hypothetical protein